MPIKRSSGRLGPIGGGVNNNTRRACEQVVSSVPLVKHCTFPVVPKLSRTSFLFLSLMLCLTSTLTQHMNLYRTVWWLPNSSIEYPVEFDSVDYFVTAHIIFMLCTPYVYLIVLKLIPSFIMTSLIMRSVLGLLIFTSWGYIMIWILNRIEYSGTTILYHLSGIVLLAYFPILTLLVCHSRYLEKVVCQDIRHHHPDSTDSSNSRMVYQPSIFSLTNCLQLFSSSCWRCLTIITDWPCLPSENMFFPTPYTFIPSRQLHSSTDHPSFQTIYYTSDLVSNNYLMNHQCLGATPEQIREEVELYRRDFNARLVDILIGTLHAVYYGCFLPIIFVQNEHLYIDYWWCLQHCFLTGLVVFLLRWHYFLPCDYIDLLHRISMHLGSWENSLTRSGYLNAISWSASTIYPCGVVVKHMQGLFRSVGINNCAEPGNRLHSRFYFIFDNPKYISSMLLCLSSFSVLYQCFCSYWVCEWYKLIGLIIDALFCFLNLYLHSRNSILVHFVYSQEKGWSLSNYLGISSLRLFSSSSSSTTSISN
ncbi:unnamed protein product [Schistosoma rodhaini]|uniref:Transmembrane protein 39A n=2 Tax=Schistosoma mansoni TaxID=6183 RepID=A0A5K4FFU4_SCHMA|nr:unnamed protein product [Schistosoma rodhaini]